MRTSRWGLALSLACASACSPASTGNTRTVDSTAPPARPVQATQNTPQETANVQAALAPFDEMLGDWV